jgi:hypothetical protein
MLSMKAGFDPRKTFGETFGELTSSRCGMGKNSQKNQSDLIISTEEKDEMSQLMSVSEMQERSQGEEDPFDLTLEKWTRIRRALDSSITLSDFHTVFNAAAIPTPFCYRYQAQGCVDCPLEGICARGRAEKFIRVMRIIQAYVLAGDVLPKETLLSEVDTFVLELETVKAKTRGTIH